jgi:hypothetical protein
MVKLDAETRAIPVLTYTTEGGGEELDESYAETSEADLFPPAKAAIWMN